MSLRQTQRFTRRGAVTPWVVLSLLLIVGIVAIGFDCGRMAEERRKAQAIADAAALAGGIANYKKKFTTSISPTSAVLASASDNGYTNDGVDSIVTVQIPPTSGAFAGKADYIEVITQKNLRASFGAIFT